MIDIVKRCNIIKLKRKGVSDSKTADELGIDRRTVKQYWVEYKQAQKDIQTESDPLKIIKLQEILTGEKHRSGTGSKHACTPETYARVNQILDEEKEKDQLLGNHKQKLTVKQIHEILVDEGFKIGYSSTKTIVNEIKNKYSECYILQDHPLGKRLEYDFGEVKLIVANKKKNYYMAVFAAPASKYRYVYLYEKANLEVFVDSHVKFFAMIGGVWQEVVYDNMKNVVSQIKRKEKILNEEAVKLSLYYGFDINTTNTRSGNEKGFVEGSVKVVRNKLFAKRYCFKDEDELSRYLEEALEDLNKSSRIEEEKPHLSPALRPYQQCEVRNCHVDHCSIIHLRKHAYSVPEMFVNQDLTVKIYLNHIDIYHQNEYICSHEKSTAPGKTIDIRHYLRTLKQKPGAISDSVALRSNPELKVIYDTYYSKEPKQFIKLVSQYKDLPLKDLAMAIANKAKLESTTKIYGDKEKIAGQAYIIASKYNQLTIGGKSYEY